MNFARENEENMKIGKAGITVLLCFFVGILCELCRELFSIFLPLFWAYFVARIVPSLFSK
jgi:hypothetical protein